MISYFQKRHSHMYSKVFSVFLILVFSFSVILPPQVGAETGVLSLPVPGTMVSVSEAFAPALIRGMTIHPDNPLRFDFIVDVGDSGLKADKDRRRLSQESKKLIKYFLAALTVPEEDMWVNLSPYEKGRLIPKGLGDTEMGRDMLAQDYFLKQLTASMMYPEDELGRKFWDKVYRKAYEKYGTVEIPMSTFNKVWIVPDKATVYEYQGSVFVIERHLKVMLEEDYMAMAHNTVGAATEENGQLNNGQAQGPAVAANIATDIIRQIILPAIEKEVNEGKAFANLRQIYNSMILATWYKKKLSEGVGLNRSLLGRIYIDKNKTKGVDTKDKQINQKIYEQYIESFKKGVYNYIREDWDPGAQKVIPRKYFSGGLVGVSQGMLKTLSGKLNTLSSSIRGKVIRWLEKLDAAKAEGSLVTAQADLLSYQGKEQDKEIAKIEEDLASSSKQRTAGSSILLHPLSDMVTEEMRTDPYIGKLVKETELSYYMILNEFLPQYLDTQEGNFNSEEMKKYITYVVEYLGREFNVRIDQKDRYDREYVKNVIEQEVFHTIYKPQFENLAKIKDMIKQGEINPEDARLENDLSLSIRDGVKTVSLGFAPQKHDPPHVGHFEAVQNWIRRQKVARVYYILDKLDFRKEELSSIYLREPQIKTMIERGMAPSIQYLPVMENDKRLWGGVGEQTFLYFLVPEIVKKNQDIIENLETIRLGYQAGVDHMQMYYKDEDGNPILTKPDVPKYFYDYFKNILETEKGLLRELLYEGKLKIPLFFSGRDADRKKFSSEELQEVIDEVSSLTDKNGKPIIEITYKYQAASISSTEIRKDHHYWKVPYLVLQWIMALEFPRWGYQPSQEKKQEQKRVADDLTTEFQKFLSGEKTPEEIISLLKTEITDATGMAVDQFDKYLNNILIGYVLKMRDDKRLDTPIHLFHRGDREKTLLEEYKGLLKKHNITSASKEDKLFEFIQQVQQEVLAPRGEQIVKRAAAEVDQKVINRLSSSPIDRAKIKEELRRLKGKVVRRRVEENKESLENLRLLQGKEAKDFIRFFESLKSQDIYIGLEEVKKDIDFIIDTFSEMNRDPLITDVVIGKALDEAMEEVLEAPLKRWETDADAELVQQDLPLFTTDNTIWEKVPLSSRVWELIGTDLRNFAIDPQDGAIYIVTENRDVVVLDKNFELRKENYLLEVGKDNVDWLMKDAYAVWIEGRYLLVTTNYGIYVYDKTTFEPAVEINGGIIGRGTSFNGIAARTKDGKLEIFVTDFSGGKISKYTQADGFVRPRKIRLASPHGLSFDNKGGMLLVAYRGGAVIIDPDTMEIRYDSRNIENELELKNTILAEGKYIYMTEHLSKKIMIFERSTDKWPGTNIYKLVEAGELSYPVKESTDVQQIPYEIGSFYDNSFLVFAEGEDVFLGSYVPAFWTIRLKEPSSASSSLSAFEDSIKGTASVTRKAMNMIIKGAGDAGDKIKALEELREQASSLTDENYEQRTRAIMEKNKVKAFSQSTAPGGIDFNPSFLDMTIKRDGSGAPLPLPQQPVEIMEIKGLVPVIINIAPVVDLPLLGFLSQEEGSEEDANAARASSVNQTPLALGLIARDETWVNKKEG